MSDPKMTPTEALALVARLRAYLTRRAADRKADPDMIHSYDIGAESEAGLHVADIAEAADAIEALARALAEAETSLERSKRLRDQYRQAVETERNHSNRARVLAQLEGQA